MRALLTALSMGVLAATGCAGGQDDPTPASEVVVIAASGDAVSAGRDLVAELECVRCHAVPGVDPAPPDKDCVGCHQRIEDGDYEAEPEVLAEWQAHIEHLTLTPDLGGAVRLRRGWIEEFLQQPHDVRPGLEATMPRLGIDAQQAAVIAAFLSPRSESARVIDGDVVRGRSLVETHGCASCHHLGGFVDPPAGAAPAGAASEEAVRLAPDLRLARERVRPDVLVEWLERPRSLHADSLMPATGLTRDEARDVAAWLMLAPLVEAPAPEVPPRLPVLERPVTFAEVDARVFKHTCWHCHSDPAYAPGGDGGPGNTGGLGFAGRGLDLSSLPAMSSGARDDEGQRRSIFRRLEDGTPALVAHLDARRIEESGGVVEGVRGMPLGLPALSREDIQLVESWIAQGRPR